MKNGIRIQIAIIALATAAFCAAAMGQNVQGSDNEWVGIWHANLDGQPTGTLTLATDTGALGGTIVLDIVSREGGHPHVIEQDPHVLMGPHIDGMALSFEVKMQKRDGSIVIASFVVTRTSSDTANVHCTTCGPNAPVVELSRDR